MVFTKPQIEELLAKDERHYCEEDENDVCVKIVAVAKFPSRFGEFQIVAFYNNDDKKEHVALVHGDICSTDTIPVRLHSQCITGDVLGSLRCDCRDQLTTAMERIGRMDKGILLYLRQEGRGIGLLNKIKAYQLQDFGYDTVEANVALGFEDDERTYAIAAHMLRSLGVGPIELMTNNPKKIEGLKKYGVNVVGRIPHIIGPNEYNEQYLKTKMEKSGHMLEEIFKE